MPSGAARRGGAAKRSARSEAARRREAARRLEREKGEKDAGSRSLSVEQAEDLHERVQRAADRAETAARLVAGHLDRLDPPKMVEGEPDGDDAFGSPSEIRGHVGLMQKAGATIGEHLHMQGDLISELHAAIDELHNRLTAVRRPIDHPEGPLTVEDAPPVSPHALTVMEHNDAISWARARVRFLIDAIEA